MLIAFESFSKNFPVLEAKNLLSGFLKSLKFMHYTSR